MLELELRFNSGSGVAEDFHCLVQLLDFKRLFQYCDGTDLQDSIQYLAIWVAGNNDDIQIRIDALGGFVNLITGCVR